MDKYKHSESLGHLTGLAGRLFNKLLTRRFSENGIEMTAEQWGVILTLLNKDALTQKEISELLYLEKSTVSRSVSVLEKRGWVTSRKNAEDGRQKQIVLTNEAKDVADCCAAIAKGVLADAQQGLDQKVLSESLGHLSGVIGNLRKLNNL